MTLPSRRVLLVVAGALLLVAVLLGVPWLSPTRGVERTWKNVISAVERNDREALAAYLSENYKDGFDLDREAALQLVAAVRGQFMVCTIRREQPELVMDVNKRAAITRALIRIDGRGSPVAAAVVQASHASQTPTEFRWRRASGKPWDWRLVSVENADASRGVARFQREAGQFGFTP
jgi:hypothetical protein